MPAPRRAILADISEQKLDPSQAYTQTNKTGKFVVSSNQVVQTKKKETKSSTKDLEQKLHEEKKSKNDDELVIKVDQTSNKEDEVFLVASNEETNDFIKTESEDQKISSKELVDDVVNSQFTTVATKSSESSKKKQKKK